MIKFYIKAERPHLCSPMASINIVSVIQGNIKESQINQVLEKLVLIHPTLSTSVEIDPSGKASLVTDSVKEMKCIWMEATDTITLESVVCDYDRKPFDLVHGPLCRFIILHKEMESAILINGHHILGDGMAYSYLMQHFIRILEDPLVEISIKYPTIIRNSDVFPRNSRLSLLPRILTTNLNKSWKKTSKLFKDHERQHMLEQYHQNHRTAICLNQLSSDDYQQLLTFCHTYEISVNTYLATAFEQAAQEILSRYKPVSNRIGIAVNVRDSVKDITTECMGNYISGIVLNQPYDKEKTFASNAIELQKSIHKQLDHPKNKMIATNLILALDDGLLDAFQFAAYSDYQNESAAKLASIFGEGKDASGIGLTNLGKDPISFPNHTYPVKDLYFICPASPGNDITIGIVTYHDHMSICIRYRSDQISDELIQQIYHKACDVK